MGIKSRFQLKMKQRLKRRKRRKKLQKAGLKDADFYYGGFFIGKSGKQA